MASLGRDVIKFIYKLFKVGYQITLMLIILTLLLNKNAANAELRIDKFWAWLDFWQRVTLLRGRLLTWILSILTHIFVNQSLIFGPIQWHIIIFLQLVVLGRRIPECIKTLWLLRSLGFIFYVEIHINDAAIVNISRIKWLIKGKGDGFLSLDDLL